MMRLISCVVVVLAACGVASLYAEEPKPLELFNGKDLTGWKQAGPGSFEVKDGELHTVGGMGLLWYTPKQFDNYTLALEFKVNDRNANSGVYVRFADPQNDPWKAVKEGEEIQIHDSAQDMFTGGIYNNKNATKLATKDPGQWNTMEVSVAGDKINVTINGQTVNEVTTPKPKLGGYVGLQNHDPNSKVSFRNIRIREKAGD